MTPAELEAAAGTWATRVRHLEADAMRWIYESESGDDHLARRILAQATGLRRLLDQVTGRVSDHARGELRS